MAEPARRYDRSIVEGPLARAVWRLAWPTMLVNIIGGLQSLVDQVIVGHTVGYTGNAAIGVSSQIFIAVIIFISSLFTGMSVLVSRFAGAGETDKVNRTVYQAFLAAVGIALFVMAPLGYFLAPSLLDFVNAAPAVQAEALPYLRIMFLASTGMLLFFMLGGALRSAGDARTPMVLGAAMTALNIVLSIILIRGLGPIPSFRTAGAALGQSIASGLVAAYALYKLDPRRVGRAVPEAPRLPARLEDHPRAVPLRPAGGVPGDRDERRRGVHALLHRLAGPERRGAGGVLGVLHPALLVRHLDIDRTDGRGGGGGGTEPGRRTAGPDDGGGAHRGANRRDRRRAAWGSSISSFPERFSPSSGSRTPRWSRSGRDCSAC